MPLTYHCHSSRLFGKTPPHALPAFRPLAVGTFGLQGQTATLVMTPSNSITYISYIYHVSPSNHLRKQQQVTLPVSLVTSRNLLQYAAIKTNNSEQLQNKTSILSIFPGALESVHTSSWQFWFQPESRIIYMSNPSPLTFSGGTYDARKTSEQNRLKKQKPRS